MVFERLAKPWPERVSGFESQSLRICCGVGSNGQGIRLQSGFLLVRIQYPTPTVQKTYGSLVKTM